MTQYKMLLPKYKYTKAFCTDEDIEMAEHVREFVDKEVMPKRHDLEGGWHRDEKLALETKHKLYAQMAKMGFAKALLPREYGGLRLSPVTRFMMVEEVARGDIGLAIELTKLDWVVSFMLMGRRKDLLEEFAPRIVGDEAWYVCVAMTEPGGGANIEDPSLEFRTIRTIAKLEGDEYIINGHKIWPGPGGPAEHFQTKYTKGILGYWTIATTDPSKGREGVGIFIIPPDAPGLTFSKPYEKMGFCYTDENVEIWFDNVRIPKRYRIDTEPGEGARIFEACAIPGRLTSAAALTGLSQAVLEIVLDWTGERKIVGKPVREHSLFAATIAEMFQRLDISRQYYMSIAWQLMHREVYGAAWSPEMRAKYSAARLFAAKTADFITDKAMELMGSYGYAYGYHVEKYMRDAKIVKLWLGGAQRDALDIAQGLYGPFKWSGYEEWLKSEGFTK